MKKYLCRNLSDFRYLKTLYENIYHGEFSSEKIILINNDKYYGHCYYICCEDCYKNCRDYEIIDVKELMRKEKLNRILND